VLINPLRSLCVDGEIGQVRNGEGGEQRKGDSKNRKRGNVQSKRSGNLEVGEHWGRSLSGSPCVYPRPGCEQVETAATIAVTPKREEALSYAVRTRGASRLYIGTRRWVPSYHACEVVLIQ